MGKWKLKPKNKLLEKYYQDQVGHLETRLSPAVMNSGTLRTPFSLKAETVRGPVILSTGPLKASWSFCVRTISRTMMKRNPNDS